VLKLASNIGSIAELYGCLPLNAILPALWQYGNGCFSIASLLDDTREQPPQPDLGAATKFLQHIRPRGPWLLVALEPDNEHPIARTFSDVDKAANFVRRHNTTSNIYYHINLTQQPMSEKASKKDMGSVEFLHVDADPAADETPAQFKTRFLPKLADPPLEPSVIIDSGNGAQLLYRLNPPLVLNSGTAAADVEAREKAIADVEARNHALALAFGAGPETRNIDRILRVPGTINHPNAVKRSRGRVICISSVVALSDAVYQIDKFSPHKGGRHDL
jgi:hypothetical protein